MMRPTYWLRKIPLSAYILLISASATVILVTGKPNPSPQPLPEPETPKIKVVTADFDTHVLTVHVQGTVEPRREIELVAELAGKVTATTNAFADGGHFTTGETLVAIDPQDYEYAVVSARANVADARQALAEETGRGRRASRDWRDLGSEDANSLFLRKPQLAAAEATLDAALAAENQASLNLERTQITAPFVGRVKQRMVDLGQYVTPGTPLATVYDTDVLEVRLALTDRQAALIDMPFTPADAETAFPRVIATSVVAGERYEWIGRIVRTEAGIDKQTRMHYVVAEFHSSEQQAEVPLLVGLFVDVQISGRELKNTVALPRNALIRRNHIYTLDSSNQIVSNTVEVLHIDKNQVVVKSGLQANDVVLVEKQSFFRPGIKITPVFDNPDTKITKGALAMTEKHHEIDD